MLHRSSNGLLGHYAGFASRFIAFVVDGVVVSLGVGMVAVATSSLQALIELIVSIQFIQVLPYLDWLLLLSPALVSLMAPLLFVSYHVLFLTTAGRTPGKALMGLRVLMLNGSRPSLATAIRRVIFYIVSALPAFAGFLWVLVDDRRQAFHDRISGTCVIYTWPAQPDEAFLAREIERLTAPLRK